jgi:hypothetical protein
MYKVRDVLGKGCKSFLGHIKQCKKCNLYWEGARDIKFSKKNQ